MDLSQKNKIIYVGSFLFPNGNAGAQRVYGIGKSLRDYGYDVVYLGSEDSGRPQDYINGVGYRYDDFIYYPCEENKNKYFKRIDRLLNTYILGNSVMRRIKSLQNKNVVAIIAYQVSSILLIKLLFFCNKNKIALLVDVVEWYDPGHLPMGKYGPFALDSEFRMRFLIGKADGVIVISTYLQKYYSSKNENIIRIPILIDFQSDIWVKTKEINKENNKLNLVFIGSAEKKDLIVNAIRGLSSLGKDANKWNFYIVGPSREEVIRNLGKDAYLLEYLGNIVITGRIDRKMALDYLRNADYTVVLRSNKRFANAGFPTKLVESLAMGVPIICNITSDIGSYICNEQEGIIVSDYTSEAFTYGLQKAMSYSSNERNAMCDKAKQTAQSSFDYRNWVEPVGEYMYKVIHDK